MKTILVWLNDQTITASIRNHLEKQYRILSAFDRDELEKKLEKQPDIIIFDYNLYTKELTELLRNKRKQFENISFVHLIDPLTLEINRYNLVAPFDCFIEKPYRSEKLLDVIKAVESKKPEKNLLSLYDDFYETKEEEVAFSPEMLDALNKVRAASETDITILFEGETGTGKTRFAQIIHKSGSRAEKPFVSINCSAIPPDLLESELFGNVKGAFTGAISDRKGKLAEADGGTLFLDETSDLPLSLQPKLLKIIEEKQWSPLGSNKTVKSDFRLICATNSSLAKKVEEGQFREDLFYRINIFPVTIPPLRKRKEEIPLLANRILREVNEKYRKTISGFSQEYLGMLINAEWKGNIRELRNKIERSALLCDGKTISLSKDASPDFALPLKTDFSQNLANFVGSIADNAEKQYLKKLLEIYKGKIGKAAEHADVDRKTFRLKLKNHSINKNDYKH